MKRFYLSLLASLLLACFASADLGAANSPARPTAAFFGKPPVAADPIDEDNDGYPADVDCDDSDPDAHQVETWYEDVDGDGYHGSFVDDCGSPGNSYATTTFGEDCDDNNDAAYQIETWYQDADSDGYYGTTTTSCGAPGTDWSTTETSTDCDDNNPDAYQVETWYQDSDSDGHYGATTSNCGAPGADWSTTGTSTDCNDNNPDAYQSEMWFQDSDSDGRHGDSGFYCGAPSPDWSQMTLGTDCNDSDPALYATSNWFMDADGDGYHPQGLEAYNVCGSPGPNFAPSTMGYDCDDNNADAHALENWYLDADGDGWFTNFMQSCGAPGAGWRRDDGLTGYGDCDDNNPGAAETTTYYLDSDADGWHTISAPFCYPPGDAEWVLSTNGPDDCDDSDASEFPGQIWYKDSDADGYSDGTTQTVCERPAQHFLANELTAISGDCDDADAARFPGNPETCDGKDNNCDSTLPADEADADMDGTATCAGDCDDNDPDPSSLDSAPPTAICQDITVTLGNDGTASRTAQAFDGGSSDGCTPANQLVFSMPLADRQFDCSEIGTQTATLTVTDLGGNTASCSANVTVAVSCGLPFGTGFEGVGFTSATLTWPAFTCPAAQTMDIYLSTENTAPASTTAPTFAAQTGTSKNLTGLDCGTTYYAWFRTNCGTDVSDWHLSPVIFATTALNWPTVNPTTTTACLGDSVTLTAISQPGTVVAWYDAVSGGNQIAIGSTLKVAPAQTTYYYAQAQVGGGTETQTFGYTGSVQTFTVPAGVTSLTVAAKGAQGGSTGNFSGGKGGKVEATLSVTPGEMLHIYVGGAGASNDVSGAAGGFNGGGNASADVTAQTRSAASGGGATDIRIGGINLPDRVLVAGGGGGAFRFTNVGDFYAAHGGAGGGLIAAGGGNGQTQFGPDYAEYHGKGGTQNAGGAGAYAPPVTPPNIGEAGSLGIGGNGTGGHDLFNFVYAGGGAGYYGGGAGHNAGGGGGSSYTDPVRASDVTHTQGENIGNGSLEISWIAPPVCTNPNRTQALVVVPIFASAYGPTYVCEGDNATLTASGGTAYQWSTGANTNTITVSETGTYGVTITHTSGCTATRTLDFSVNLNATYYYDEDGDGFHSQTQTDCISPGMDWSTATSGYDCDDNDPDPSTGDLQPPTAICRDVTVALDEAGEGSFDVEDIDNGSFDNCTPGKGLRFYVPGEEREFDCDFGNDLSATLTVTDEGGLTSTCSALVTVLDILHYQHTHTREASDAAAADKLGFGLAMGNGFMVAGAPDHKVGIHHKRGAAYVFGEITDGWEGWEEIQQIVASDGAAVDYFGNAAAIDGYTMVVGAHGDNFGTITDQGSAYIYYPLGPYPSIWTQVAKISASDGAAYDYFAGSVSVKGSVAAAGAAKKKIGANTAQGAAYIFYQDAGGTDKWGQVKKLVASDGAANNFFGNSVSIGDDADLLLVGANGNASNRGAAYLFAKDQGGANNWGQVKKLTASDPAIGDGFGVSVSLDEEYAIVGAPNKNGYRGAAYIFAQNRGGTNNWGQVKKLTSPDAAANDRFGQTVVVKGQYAYVTAIRANGNAGAVYVFHRVLGGPDNWGHVGTYTNEDGDSGDQFGYALAVDREYLAASANLADMDVRDRGTNSPSGARGPVLTDAGEVYVFTGENCATRSEDETKSHVAREQAVAARNLAASPAHPLAVPPSVKCSPNPFRDELTVEIDAIGGAKLTVTDAAGRTMTSVDLPEGLGRFTLETSAFRDGMYFVQVSSESGVRVVPVALMR